MPLLPDLPSMPLVPMAARGPLRRPGRVRFRRGGRVVMMSHGPVMAGFSGMHRLGARWLGRGSAAGAGVLSVLM